ncbi:MAG: hypothetical protein P8100_08210 [bacterium]
MAKNIGLTLFDTLKGRNTASHYRQFRKLLRSDADTNVTNQLEKLGKLLAHAYDHVPFYRKRMDAADLDPRSITSLKDLEKLPPLTREDLQNHWQEIIADNTDVGKLDKGTSSGSTGVAVVYYKDSNGSSGGQAAHFIGWELAGWQFGMKGLHIWGNPTTVKNEWNRPLSRLKARIYNHHKFPSYKLSEGKEFERLVNLVREGGYRFVDGYTNAIYMLADYMENHNIQLDRKLDFVLPTAENLQDFQRATIEKMLGPVYDDYGCSEINGIAIECRECRKYHIIEPHVIVEFGEVLDEEGSRELIITDLDNFGFPLIRYKNNDAGIPAGKEAPVCSVPWSRLSKVSGRQSDIINLPGGGTLSVPSFFGSMLLKKINGIKQYQIEKLEENLLRVKFVTSEKFSEQDKKLVSESLDEYLAGKIRYEIAFVDKIPVSKTGKFKLLVDKTKET